MYLRSLRHRRAPQESSLLGLPQEVRDHIWTEVLGSNFIHIKYRGPALSSPGLYHDAYTSNTIILPFPHTPEPPKDHAIRYICPPDDENPMSLMGEIQDDTSYQMSLTLLRVCRQTYTEGTAILYSTNTFSFQAFAADAFKPFLSTRTQMQQGLLRSMDISLMFESLATTRDDTFPDTFRWDRALDPCLMRQLPCLHRLHLHLISRIQPEDKPVSVLGPTALDIVEGNPLFQRLLRLKVLPLQEVTITVVEHPMEFQYLGPGYIPKTVKRPPQWSTLQKEACTNKIKFRLLRTGSPSSIPYWGMID